MQKVTESLSRRTLREWQKEASSRFLESEKKDFLARITPGGGKTFWALKMAAYLRSEGSVDQIAIIVPSVVIKRQWQEEAQRHFSLVLSDIDEWGDESAGFITTYQKIATGQMPEVMREFCQESRVLAIFDEIHHGSDHNTWGTKLRTAFELAERRLCLTGTPFRSDGREVPFVQYVDDVCSPDYSYTYGQAVADDIVRQLRFQLVDGISSWNVEGQTEEALLSKSESTGALNAALEADKDFVATMILAAEQKRRELPEGSACLVLAKDTKHASELAKAVRSVTGHKPVLVHSNTDQPAKRIADFRESSTPWIVSVRMISEGADIPRIRCLCWLTNYSTELFFEQAVARCVRGRATEEAWVFLPETPLLASYAASFEDAELPALKPQGSENGNIATGERSRRTVEYLDSEGFLSKVVYVGKFESAVIRRVSNDAKSDRKTKCREYQRRLRQKPEYRVKSAEYRQRRSLDPVNRDRVAELSRKRNQDPDRRAKLTEYQRNYKARKKAEKLKANGCDCPPPSPSLDDLDGVRNYFLALHKTIRAHAPLGWTWDEFEKTSPRETARHLREEGMPNWATGWYDLAIRLEQLEGHEISLNLGITRGFWMRKTIRARGSDKGNDRELVASQRPFDGTAIYEKVPGGVQ